MQLIYCVILNYKKLMEDAKYLLCANCKRAFEIYYYDL